MFRKLILISLCVLTLLPLLSVSSYADFTGDDKVVVVLDPGHGGKDSGSLGTQYESYYNLKVAQYCADALNKNGNFIVKMTRTTQSEELTLAQRGLYGDSVNADILVSIHFNSSTSSAPHGIEVYSSVLPQFDLSALAKSTANKLGDATGLAVRGTYRRYDDGDGVHKYYWSEKYQWDVPDDPSVGGLSDHYGIITWVAKFGYSAMIIEHAFLSNPGDLAITDKEENLKKMGEANAEAIIEYFTNHTHTYADSYTQDYPVSCFSAGKQSIRCTICKHRKNVAAVADAPDANAHLWIAEDTVQPTCYSDGSANMYCRYTHNLIDKGCEQFEEHNIEKVLPKLVHNYVVTFSQALTHTQDGITKYACTYCNDSYTETEYAEGHSYEFLEHTDPTCTENGGDSYKCTECGDIRTDVEYALGHNNVEIERTDATCETDGEVKYECTVCSAITVELLASTGHNYAAQALSELTCTSDKEILYTCSDCGDEYTEKTAASGHSYEIISQSEPDCSTAGVTVFECSVCGDSYEETVPALGHSWSEGEVTKAASLFSAGEMRFVCSKDDSHIDVQQIKSSFAYAISENKVIIVVVAVVILLTSAGGIALIILKKRKQSDCEDTSFEKSNKNSDVADESDAESEANEDIEKEAEESEKAEETAEIEN